MTPTRNPLLSGLALTFRRFPALLWAFAFNLAYAALSTTRIAQAIGGVTNTSLAAASLHRGFDLGTVATLAYKMSDSTNDTPSFSTSVILYLATYFLLVPGTLLCYQTGAKAKLSTLLQTGLLHFWRFVRITLLSLIVFGLILGPLAALQGKWSEYVDDHAVGLPAFLAEMTGVLLIALVAAILRLYFDLVEVYTVQLGLHLRPNGKPDRRVRKTLLPAWRALRANFSRVYPTFLLLAFFGLLAIFLGTRAAFHSLAKPSAAAIFLFTQLGLFLMLLSRFWQRGAETILALDFPIVERPIVRSTFVPRPQPPVPAPVSAPIPDPEPPTPPLAHPDPGIFPSEPPIASPS